jgi:hypothetical protein
MSVCISLIHLLGLLKCQLATCLNLMDMLYSHRGLQHLIGGSAICIYQVVPVVGIEWGCTNGQVVMVVVHELCHMKEVCPIVLAIGREDV